MYKNALSTLAFEMSRLDEAYESHTCQCEWTIGKYSPNKKWSDVGKSVYTAPKQKSIIGLQ